jgi:hypothetical protein
VHDALPAEGKAGSAIALALHELEAMALAFGDAVAPLEGESGLNGWQIHREHTGEAGHFRDAPVGCLRHPRTEGVASALPDEDPKGLAQGIGPGHAGIQLAQLLNRDLRRRRPLGR